MAVLDVDAGRLTARLVLEEPQATDDGQGGAEVVFAELGRVWALVEPKTFAEEVKGPGLVSEVTHQVTLRARGDLTPGQRLRKGARVFEIMALRDLDETGRFALALCREVTG
ncbi:head-tail adaptor protein [Rhizobium sp. Root274]|uniref:phage head closure protein n=1 Tax=unclassified Rhizobium TaxID=2613769 RepID=UPI000714D795|nr:MULTISPECIES: phage head closure protein [unclassified Rhizobium]KQW31141.1 head-tail adaptor protein [Rhizobium sp. Root1240]KRD32689.1 head-tail adaptor protein [Rhizobium sp. Root274]